MVIGIVVGVVIVALIVLLKWADRRDRANGHRSRKITEIMSTMRAERMNMRNLRRPGGYGAVSPHEFGNKRDPHHRR